MSTEEKGITNQAFSEEIEVQSPEANGGTLNATPQKGYTLELDSKPPKDQSLTDKFKKLLKTHTRAVNIILISLLNILVGIYFAWATYHYFERNKYSNAILIWNNINATKPDAYCQGMCGIQWCNGYGMLLILIISTYIGLIYYKFVKPTFGSPLNQTIVKPLTSSLSTVSNSRIFSLVFISSVLLIFAVYIYFDTIGSRQRIRSLLGIFILFGFGYVFSTNKRKIKWRPVLGGICFQFLLGIFCIRIEVGRKMFACIGAKVAMFLSYTIYGSKFVFGDYLVVEKGIFVFAVLPVIFFFSFIISVLYYYGAMQWVIQKLGWILQSILGTTVCESVNAAANIFLGMTESPLVIKPYIKYLTASELHAIMASGFATVSGTVLAAYISFGADPSHLITSSVMAAPAALAFSKLFYPEEEESKTKAENISLEKSKDSSALDAASNGAMAAIPLVAGIVANLIAFVSFISFLNGAIGWLGYLIGHDYLSFEWIFGKLFIPLAYIIGIPWNDCDNIGKVIASKTIINEFVAYQQLGSMKAAGLISLRSSSIATFAVCGFANPSSLGIMIGNLSSLCPEKKGLVTSVAFRALITGAFVCFINASIAGLLMSEGT